MKPMDSSGDPAAEIGAAARRFLRLFALNDVDGIAACYTEDAQMLPANMGTIHGREAIRAAFKFTGGRGDTLEFETQELDVHGTSAVEIGRYTRRRRDGSIFDLGKYIVIWQRVGGEWKLHRDMFSTSQPKTAAVPAFPRSGAA
jgi:ketosteroid isomerase-like protein